MRLLILSLILAGAPVSAAQNQVDDPGKGSSLATKCDKNGDRVLSLHEKAIYNIHKANPMADKLDPQCNGTTDATYLGQHGQDLLASMVRQEEAKLVAEQQVRVREGVKPLPLTTTKELEAKPNMANDLGGFQIRSTIDQITSDPETLNDGAAFQKAYDKASPAVFSYGYNHNSEKSTWTAKGVVAYPVLNSDKSRTLIIPSVDFYKLDDGIKKDANDSLIFRLGNTFDMDTEDDSVLLSNEVRFSSDYTTDFGFYKEAPGGELDYNPIFSQKFLNGNANDAHPFQNEGANSAGWLAVHWNVFLHLEGGAELENEAQNQDYLRIGPNVELDFIPLFNPNLLEDMAGDQVDGRVKIALNYYYYPNLFDGPDVSHFSAKLISYFDKSKHFSLNLEYDIGEKAITAIQEDQYLISLGIKF
jgi:hypothetical protein